MNQQTVAQFYDYSERFRLTAFQSNLASYAIHYGLWDDNVKNREEALLNTNKTLASIAGIKPGDYILDAGCGVGGSTVWLAKEFKTSVVGITLSQKEATRAADLAERYKASDLTDFQVMDFTKTEFPDKSFDVIWAIESVIYSFNKRNFLKEAYRILRKKGKLIIADAFLNHNPENYKEEHDLEAFKDGFAVPNIMRANIFEAEMQNQGFTKTQSWDKTEQILPSVKQTYLLCLLSLPTTLLTQVLHITPAMVTKNVKAGIAQKDMYESGFLSYRIFFGKKE